MSAAGEEFDRLMRPLVPSLYRYAYRWTNSVDRAEDLVQELLTRLFPRLEELRAIERLRPWAARVMYRIFVDGLRRERNSPVRFLSDLSVDEGGGVEEEVQTDPRADPLTYVDLELTRKRLSQAWAQLSEPHRAVLAMHDIEGYGLPELAEILDTPLGTLKSRLHRARAHLRELLSRNDSDSPFVSWKEGTG